MKLKVMSFNVLHFENYNTGKIDFDFFAENIAMTGADIIGLNEVHGKGSDPEYEDQTGIMCEKLGYYGRFGQATFIDGDNPFGNAILSRYPVKHAEVIPIPDPENPSGPHLYETRCILKTVLDVEGEELTVFVTHFGLNDDEHVLAVKTVLENVSGKCIFMGDLNVTPDNPYLQPLKEKLDDTAREDDEMLSFPSDKPFKKIDYIFTQGDIRTLSSRVIPLVVSDHRPYFAELEV